MPKLRVLSQILIWPGATSEDFSEVHFWYEWDGKWQRVCDGHEWPDTQLVSSSDAHASSCQDCLRLYADDMVMGYYRMKVVYFDDEDGSRPTTARRRHGVK